MLSIIFDFYVQHSNLDGKGIIFDHFILFTLIQSEVVIC